MHTHSNASVLMALFSDSLRPLLPPMASFTPFMAMPNTFMPCANAAALPDAQLYVRPGESHLGGFAAASEVLEILADIREEADANDA